MSEITKEEFEDLYLTKGKSLVDIIKLKNISYRKGRYYMMIYNIKVRKGPHNFKDITGKTFNRLTAIKRVENTNTTSALWLCKCKCGKEVIVDGPTLRYRNRNSCGCYKFEAQYKGYKDISKTYWGTIVRGAKKRKLEMNITMEDAWELWEKQNGLCLLTGQKLILNKHYSKEQTASLDRIDNKQGYIKNNIRWVHKDINLLRNNRTDEQLITLCKQIVSYYERE